MCVRYTIQAYIHALMRDEKVGRSKQGQTNNKAKQHSTPKAVTFPKKNELLYLGCMYMVILTKQCEECSEVGVKYSGDFVLSRPR